MSDDAFDFDTALAARKAEEAARRERGLKLNEWRKETCTDSYIVVRRVSGKVEETLREFLRRGGRIQPSRTVWIPHDHPYDKDIVIDEGCILSPPLPKFESADSYPIARMRWEKQRNEIRAEVTAMWEAKYPRVPAMDFGFWEQEGPHETVWIFVDGDGAAWSFGSDWPNLEKVREKLVDALHRQTP